MLFKISHWWASLASVPVVHQHVSLPAAKSEHLHKHSVAPEKTPLQLVLSQWSQLHSLHHIITAQQQECIDWAIIKEADKIWSSISIVTESRVLIEPPEIVYLYYRQIEKEQLTNANLITDWHNSKWVPFTYYLSYLPFPIICQSALYAHESNISSKH